MLLIQADVGWDVSQSLVAELQEKVREERVTNPADAREILRLEMTSCWKTPPAIAR